MRSVSARLVRPSLHAILMAVAPALVIVLVALTASAAAMGFAHGSNDGQKGMGLIMLILIGCAPTAYALNRTLPASETPAFVRSAAKCSG